MRCVIFDSDYERAVFLIFPIEFVYFSSSSCTCPSGYTGEHCEFRVDIHGDRLGSAEERVGLNTAFTLILILVAMGLPVVILVTLRSFRSSSIEPMDNMPEDNTRTSYRDGIILDKNVESAERGKCENGGGYVGRGGFSSVEIL